MPPRCPTAPLPEPRISQTRRAHTLPHSQKRSWVPLLGKKNDTKKQRGDIDVTVHWRYNPDPVGEPRKLEAGHGEGEDSASDDDSGSDDAGSVDSDTEKVDGAPKLTPEEAKKVHEQTCARK